MITERIKHPWRKPKVDNWEAIHVPDSTVSLKPREPVSFQDLLGNAPVQEHSALADEVYRKYLTTPLSVYSVNREEGVNGTLEYVVVGSKMTAYEVNAMLYFAAPDKSNGFATEEILENWNQVSTADEYPMAIESYIPTEFDPFTTEGDRIANIITRNASATGYASQDMDDTLIPVLRMSRSSDGIRINIEPFDEDLMKTILSASQKEMRIGEQASLALGILYLAAYSPQRKSWPEDITPATVFSHVYTEIEKAQQENDAHAESDIQKSRLLLTLADHAAL